MKRNRHVEEVALRLSLGDLGQDLAANLYALFSYVVIFIPL
jgi:hypothetical protein